MNFIYDIANMDIVGDNDTVLRLHYRVSAQKDGCDLIPVRSGAVELSPPGDNFIPFEDITKDQAITWLKEKIDCEKIEQSLANEIESFVPDDQQPSSSSKTPSSWAS